MTTIFNILKAYKYIFSIVVASAILILAFASAAATHKSNHERFLAGLAENQVTADMFLIEGFYSVCRYGSQEYRVSTEHSRGSFYIDLDKQSFTEKGGVLSRGSDVSESEFWERLDVEPPDLQKVLSAFDGYSALRCIKQDINFGGTAVVFDLGGRGFIYASQSEHYRQEYISKRYPDLSKINQEGWLSFGVEKRGQKQALIVADDVFMQQALAALSKENVSSIYDTNQMGPSFDGFEGRQLPVVTYGNDKSWVSYVQLTSGENVLWRAGLTTDEISLGGIKVGSHRNEVAVLFNLGHVNWEQIVVTELEGFLQVSLHFDKHDRLYLIEYKDSYLH